MKYFFYLLALVVLLALQSCNTMSPTGLFGKRSPHEQYSQKLKNAGLNNTALARLWLAAAQQSLENPLSVVIPYKEVGYFPEDKARATAIRFEAKRGEKLSINLGTKPEKNFKVFVDLWEIRNNKNKKRVAHADTGGRDFHYEIENSGFFLIRIQPELLVSGEYTLTITNGPSLAFPVKGGRIGSFWGADRENGARRHEGIDIFATRRTPAIAAANGTISRVTTNQLGGKVIFMRPEKKNFSLYYAHLDEQLVEDGQKVKAGDTIGLVGNTGNALTTSPHLHFGIYTPGGAIDPLAFVNPTVKKPKDILSSLNNLGKMLRTSKKAADLRDGATERSNTITVLDPTTVLEIQAATGNSYKVLLPNGDHGFVTSNALGSASTVLYQMILKKDMPLLDKPFSGAARIKQLNQGTTLNILGKFENYSYVKADNENGWIENN